MPRILAKIHDSVLIFIFKAAWRRGLIQDGKISDVLVRSFPAYDLDIVVIDKDLERVAAWGAGAVIVNPANDERALRIGFYYRDKTASGAAGIFLGDSEPRDPLTEHLTTALADDVPPPGFRSVDVEVSSMAMPPTVAVVDEAEAVFEIRPPEGD